MAEPLASFSKFNYSLRPSKQIERKILIEILLRLSGPAHSIQDYAYVGLGSVYYVDFVLFHKYLYIKEMMCVEREDIPRRMRFNRPYDFIKLYMMPFAEAIPRIIRPRKKVLAWVDYDSQLSSDMLEDIDSCMARMRDQSIFIITVDARARVPALVVEENDLTVRQQERWLVRQFQEQFGWLLGRRIRPADLDPAVVPSLYHEIISLQIQESLARRNGLEFIQLFNFLYADGAPMLTIGGMLGTPADRQRLQECGILGHRFVRQNQESVRIKVPPLTGREKQWLDSNLTAKRMEFELADELRESYLEYYREYPTYVETLT